MKKTIGIAIFTLLCHTFYAQNEMDVLRYSTTDFFGSARVEAMAGSFGALGADISAIQINPASMGRFSSSRVAVSFNNSIMNNEAEYNSSFTNSSRNKFTLGSGGVVFTSDLSERGNGRLYNQFTLGYTRLKSFANKRVYEGQNFYSLLDVFANDGYGVSPDNIYSERPFTTGLAYDVYAVDYDEGTGEYYSRLTNGDMYHHREINTNGGMGEFHIGYSENYMNTLYYGASIGIRRIKYIENTKHNEKLLEPAGVSLRSFDYVYDQTSKGTGFNIKLGMLYLPSEQFRIGLAFESSTTTKMTDEWSADMTAHHDYGVEQIAAVNVPKGKFVYRVKTPMKLRGSFAYILGMRGAINIDVEMARLPRGKLKTYTNDELPGYLYEFDYENQEVVNQFRTIFNTRIGAEYMIFNDVYLRGGIAILPQPYKKDIGNIKTPNMTYAAGIGWENKYVQIDLSYRLLTLNEDYYAFDPSKVENRTTFKTNVHNIVLSAGIKF